MQSRLVRYAALAGLLGACAQDPKTHVSFSIDASTSGGGDARDAAAAAEVPIITFDASTITDGVTTGCGMDPGQDIGKYVQYHISVSGPDLDTSGQPKVRSRTYYVRLPTTYDPATPFRVVYLGPGCGGTTDSSVIQLNSAAMEAAILVAVIPLPDLPYMECFDESINSVEYPFFDALHKKIENSFCVDAKRQFYAGFSTGARLGNMLGCVFPDVLRAQATIQGALPPLPACKDHPIAAFTLADTLETGNPYMANVMASERVMTANKCNGMASAPYDTGPGTVLPPTASCVKYTGCPADYPVVFCTTTGQGHMTFEPFSDFAFWNFFKAF